MFCVLVYIVVVCLILVVPDQPGRRINADLTLVFILLNGLKPAPQQSFGVGQPRRIENAKILIANTPMDTDKIKIYGSRVSYCLLATVCIT